MKRKVIIIGCAVVSTILSLCMLAGCDRSAPELSGINETVEVMCGTDFNIEEYLNENLQIKDETDDGTAEYKLSDLEHSITCEGSIYDEETGKIDTGDFGKFDFTLTIKDEAGNKSDLAFALKLNPLDIEKGFYVYKDEISSGGFSVLGYCEYINKSEKFLQIDSVEFEYLDAEGTTVCSTDMTEYTPMYVAPGKNGYGQDTYASTEAILSDPDDVAEVKVNIKYSKAKKEDDNTLIVGDMEMIHNYDSNVSGFAAQTTVENPYAKKVENYLLLAGMYDGDGQLIGVMDAMMNSENIGANGKAKTIAVWLPDSTERPDKTKEVKGCAHVVEFGSEE